jgi:murein DD-endopeptidase MepM/ murein hydrolase activator NlpD
LPLSLSLLAALNAYVFLSGDTSVPRLLRASMMSRNVAGDLSGGRGVGWQLLESLRAGGARATETPGSVLSTAVTVSGRRLEGTVRAGDTFEALFRRLEVEPGDASAASAAVRGHVDERALREGQRFTVSLDRDGRVDRIQLRLTPARSLWIERAESGRLVARRQDDLVEIQVAEVGGVVTSSLYEAIERSGESASLVSFFVDVLSWDLDFYTDSHPGDRFKLVIEKQYLHGAFYRYGQILAAEYSGRAGTFRAFHFRSADGKVEGYFDEQGRSIVKTMLKTPLKFARVSSKFMKNRFHPVLHAFRSHRGVDYAAPTGTPVWASAHGKVLFAGWRNGSGNTVVLGHSGGLETLYYHLSRLAPRLRPGTEIRQKQLVGYVGATGLATGPHLHFAVKVGGNFVDPAKMKISREGALPVAYRRQFLSSLSPRMAALERVPMAGSSVVSEGRPRAGLRSSSRL